MRFHQRCVSIRRICICALHVAITQLMAGGGVMLLGLKVVPLLSGLIAV